MTGTGEQIIRTALARDLCERANPNHCEDTVGGIETSFERFSNMQSPDILNLLLTTPQNPAKRGERRGLLGPLS